MLKERIQEIFEFTNSESPYRKANKGWINEDIFMVDVAVAVQHAEYRALNNISHSLGHPGLCVAKI